MFKLLDGRQELFQWDTERKLIVSDPAIDEVHFCNRTDECSLVCEVYEENGLTVVDIPNILLQDNWNIRVYGYCGGCYTKQAIVLKVNARTRPADYVYTETEVKTYDALEARITELEEESITSEDLTLAIEDYFVENPIEMGATEEQAAQIEKNAADIKALQEEEIDLSPYALKTEIPTVPTQVSAFENDAGYLTEHQDLSNYALKTEIPTVPTNVSAFENDAGYLTEHQDLSNYALKSEIPDVSGFTTMAAVEAKGYQTETQVNALIDAKLGVIENGTY